jgi:hypothetical protein
MDIAKLVLDYIKAILVWPLITIISIWIFRKEMRVLLEHLAGLIDRIKKADFAGVSLALSDRLAGEVVPHPSQSESATQLEFSASTGGYSTDYRAIFIVVGITNRTQEADQVVEWKFSIPSEHVELDPGPAPSNILPEIPMWSATLVDIPPHKFIRGTLFFRGRGVLPEVLPHEPLLGRLTARTLYGKELSSEVKVYSLSTLQQNPPLDV